MITERQTRPGDALLGILGTEKDLLGHLSFFSLP